MTRRILPALALALLLGSSAVLAADARLVEPWSQGPERAQTIASLVADSGLTQAELAQAAQSGDWRVRHQAAVVAGWRAHTELFERFELEPAYPTRAGFPRFRGPELADKRLAPLFVERLLQGPSYDMKLALLEVIPRTGGDFGDSFVGLLREEDDTRLRGIMVASLKNADRDATLEGLRLGFADVDGAVRGEAARAAGWSDHGSELVPELVEALGDTQAYTRAMAARSLGYLRAGQAFDALLPCLADSEPDVRLNAINALERLDAERLAARPELNDLAHDPDPGVVRAALRVR